MKIAVAVLVAVATLTVAAIGPDLSGAWTLNLDPDFSGHPDAVPCTFHQAGAKLTIRCDQAAASSRSEIVGEVTRDRVVFRVPTGRHDELRAVFSGTLDATAARIVGTWRLVDERKYTSTGKFTATKN